MSISANAQPEKRLFISLLTRDLSLVDAFLDILDNSINAAMEPYADRLVDAKGYHDLLSDVSVVPAASIRVIIGQERIDISDDAGGISLALAESKVFAFGHPTGSHDSGDRLSVYGIGLKRAIFKMGNRIKIVSNHPDGGFSMDLPVDWWENQMETPWKIPIEAAPYDDSLPAGTSISISELYGDVLRRLSDPTFLTDLKYKISRTYSYFLGRIINIVVNDEEIAPTEFRIGSNYAHDTFEQGAVSYSVTVGIGVPAGGRFLQETAGWFVFCNGRTVLYADKSAITGWGSLLPTFQPKHRPFIGLVFFVSLDPEDLPWTTTKASVNQESLVWQEARRNMAVYGREVIGFLDRRYTDDGTEVLPEELLDAAGENVSVLSASVSTQKTFTAPTFKPPENVSIQYQAKVLHVEKIKKYLGRNMSAREVGKYTFDYFYKNEANQ